jgi:glutamate-1-semialdehyde 2,1-aminomutase
VTTTESEALNRYRQTLADEFDRKFPRSRAAFEAREGQLLDDVSHAMRWNEPFMPIVRKASGAAIEDLDGHRMVDYWQGHFANILGHNPPVVTQALIEALADGRGLQTGMLHEIEDEVARLLCGATGMETSRLTTSGTLGTFYSVVLARAFTGRDRVLKVSGGWHGSQPFGLKGVAPKDGAFDRLESEGLSSSVGAEVVVTRFNDVEQLRALFDEQGDRLACFLLEPVLGAGGGMVASPEYLGEARRLTEQHGALLLCDEIITGFRFRAGDLSGAYGIRPDLLILGKVMGGGMPVAAVTGRRDVLSLTTREKGRVKFEGGTYCGHELSLVGARAMLRHLIDHEAEIYPELARKGDRMRQGLAEIADKAGFPLQITGPEAGDVVSGSLVFAHPVRERNGKLTSPDQLMEERHPLIGERLLKATLLLEEISSRSGLGSLSTVHDEADMQRTLDGYAAGLERLQRAGLV